MAEQLCLFDYLQNPKFEAEVVCHPHWLKARAQHAAFEILSRPLDKQLWHRRDKVSVFQRQLEAAGLTPAAASKEADKYSVLVECEMRRQIIAAIMLDERGGAA